MNDNRFIELLIKKNSGEITLSEQRELAELVNSNPEFSFLSESLEEVFQSNLKYAVSEDEVNIALKAFHKKQSIGQTGINTPEKKIINSNFLKMAVAAAVTAVLISLGFIYSLNKKSAVQESPNIVSTKKGSKSAITMPDGTRVWINADTRLTYDETFGKENRDVNLVGEAYFDVTKDKDHPFIVHTKNMDVRVLGTAFNVKAYANENTTQTTLIRGVVEVILHSQGNKKLTLKPFEKIIVQNKYVQEGNNKNLESDSKPEIALMRIKANEKDSSIIETDWVKNKLVFEQEKLIDIIPALERWYNVQINIRNKKLIGRRFSGRFENENLAEVLETLSLSLGFNYTIKGDNMTFY